MSDRYHEGGIALGLWLTGTASRACLGQPTISPRLNCTRWIALVQDTGSANASIRCSSKFCCGPRLLHPRPLGPAGQTHKAAPAQNADGDQGDSGDNEHRSVVTGAGHRQSGRTAAGVASRRRTTDDGGHRRGGRRDPGARGGDRRGRRGRSGRRRRRRRGRRRTRRGRGIGGHRATRCRTGRRKGGIVGGAIVDVRPRCLHAQRSGSGAPEARSGEARARTCSPWY